MIKNIIFDFGGVLLDWNPRYLYKDYFRDGREMEHFLADVCTLERNSELDCGFPFAEWVRKYQKMLSPCTIQAGRRCLAGCSLTGRPCFVI